MSGGLNEVQPEGRGFKGGSRERSFIDIARVSGAKTAWTPNTKQERALVAEVGIDLIVWR